MSKKSARLRQFGLAHTRPQGYFPVVVQGIRPTARELLLAGLSIYATKLNRRSEASFDNCIAAALSLCPYPHAKAWFSSVLVIIDLRPSKCPGNGYDIERLAIRPVAERGILQCTYYSSLAL